MGSEEYEKLKFALKQIKSGKGEKAIYKYGKIGYTSKKARVYKENYINEMSKYSNFKGYDKLIKKMKSMRPLEFYEKIKNDIFVVDLTYQSDTYLRQSGFNQILEAFGIDISEFDESD